MSEDDLSEIRRQIDRLDQKLQALISERATLAQRVAEVKTKTGEKDGFYRPGREAEILRGVVERNDGPLSDDTVVRLFREIMSSCLALQHPLRVAYFGPAGTYTQAATFKHFGHGVNALPLPAIDDVFREVASGSADYGVVPIENSTEGVVTHTLDMFARSNLKICGEIVLPVHHCLLSCANELASIDTVYSHSQSLGQCRRWLDTHLPNAQRESVSSNAEAARRVAELSDGGGAAVASRDAADVYGLKVLAENIEDEPDNTTRFLVIGRQEVNATGDDKTSLMVSAANQPGALYAVLEPFARHGVSLTRIESRPSRRSRWDYNFFLDIEGHTEDAPVAAALAEVKKKATVYKILGSYPTAIG
ncbi:MAG: prephenate dehydratase [Pseudomonadota bacterium]|nr:prephenate dehydratase [Pseudomonadota bacterium]